MITDRSIPDIETNGVLDVLIRRMFIKSEDTYLLPRWAKFVRGVIDSPALEPTAARDSYKLEHPSVPFLTRQLGAIIVGRLIHLSKAEPAKFKRINHWHHYHLKGMACVHQDFFDQVGGLLLFRTNQGDMSLETYLTKNAPRADLGNRIPIYYFSSTGAATQFKRLADARGWSVVNAPYVFEEEFLRKYSEQKAATTTLVCLDVTDDPSLFQPVTPAEDEAFRPLVSEMQSHLIEIGADNARVRMRRFLLNDIPAVIVCSKKSEHDGRIRELVTRAALASSAEEILKEMIDEMPATPININLNPDNRLIQRISNLSRRTPLSRSILTGIYNCAIVNSHNLLTERNTTIMHDQFLNLLELLLAGHDAEAAIRAELERERQTLLEYRSREAAGNLSKPEHVRLFMMTPFDTEYMAIEDAVRDIFRTHPYYFEVQLARDYTFGDSLLDNIREHIGRAHGFVAEISTLNANVMFELGAVMLADDKRPVFTLRSRKAEKDVRRILGKSSGSNTHLSPTPATTW